MRLPYPMGIGRNDPCPCGSGMKYKKCCLQKDVVSAPRTVAGWDMDEMKRRLGLPDR